ncbi:hypothetical protein UG55_102041 [Frankia sp. EI5c]|nr:hypothetical protein UG55_102041 [Frankia sp. EI5c]
MLGGAEKHGSWLVDALTGSPVLAAFVVLLVGGLLVVLVAWSVRGVVGWARRGGRGIDPGRIYTAAGAHSRAWATSPVQSAPRRRARVARDMIPSVSQAVGRTAEVASARVASV